MAKKLIDANVILRYLLRDVEEMAEASARVIQSGAFTLPEVLAEVVYVLKSVYHIERREISKALLFFMDAVEIERREVMVKALEIFAATNLDFVDCILAACHEVDSAEVFTFDKKLNRLLSRQGDSNV